MTSEIQFQNPPITEALFDIRVKLPEEVNLLKLSEFHEQIKSDFPKRTERHRRDFQIKTSPIPEPIISSDRVDGYLFQTDDGKKIVQARLDGFTFNKLKPYSDWETFSNEAKGLWRQYVAIAKPLNITRLALRYINRVEIPLPFKMFQDYVLTIPDIAPGIKDGLAGFFARLIIPNQEIQAKAVVTETIENKAMDQGVLPLIFDIDVSRKIILDPVSEDIDSIMESLRCFKNQIFLNSFTDKAKELFK